MSLRSDNSFQKDKKFDLSNWDNIAMKLKN